MFLRTCCLVPGILLLLVTGVAQPYFQNTYSLQGYSFETGAVARFSSGQIAVAGAQIHEQTGQKVPALILLSSTGNVIWARQFDIGFSSGQIADLATSPDGKLLVVFGKDYLTQGVSGLALLNLSGTIEWSKQISTSTEVFFRVSPLKSGYLVTGLGGTDAQMGLVVKIGPDGQEIWRRTLKQPNNSIELQGAWEDEQGYLYLSGKITDIGLADGLLVKMTADGDLEWMHRLGTGEIDALSEVAPASSNQLLLGGYTFGFDGYARAWLTRTDRSGTVKWSRSYQLNGDDIFLSGLQVQGSAIVLALSGQGATPNLGAGMAQVNDSGDLLWVKKFDPPGQVARHARLAPSPADGFLLAADAQAGISENAYVVRANTAGDAPPCCLLSSNLTVVDLSLKKITIVPDVAVAAPLIGVNWSASAFSPLTTPLCQPPKLDFTLSDSSICPGACIDLSIVAPDPAVNYTWTYPGGVPDAAIPDRVCFPGATTNISITLTANGCQKSTKQVALRPVPEQFPNVFTPNHDQVNDRFLPLLYCPVQAYHFMVFNRWGEQLFDTTDPAEGWDGTFNGQDAASDVYAWVVEFKAAAQDPGEWVRKSGSVTLLR